MGPLLSTGPVTAVVGSDRVGTGCLSPRGSPIRATLHPVGPCSPRPTIPPARAEAATGATGPFLYGGIRSPGYQRSHVVPTGAAAPAARSALQHRALRHLPVRQVAPERDHVLDNVAQTAPDLVLILSREGLRPARRGAETTPAEPSAPPRSRRSAGQGGDDGPAAWRRAADRAAPSAGGTCPC